jgi:hypothetical protein
MTWLEWQDFSVTSHEASPETAARLSQFAHSINAHYANAVPATCATQLKPRAAITLAISAACFSFVYPRLLG